ncbi:alpha/beta fold hydrolase [Aquabacterium humicola]|uniref:alpha/beta fold hydrolase n=1 Tax=Aquabacterium humicola TaxID=3237377 RepID=UPI002543C67A|nr:alpha/beta fold hydrolase [Rubrivivax pictus]
MRVFANGLEFEVDDQGPPNGEALLLIMGLGMQLIAWPDELVTDLVGRGFRVIRFDNRDIGLSSHLDHLGVPNLMGAALRHTLHLKVHAPYTVQAMAEDALGVLDALGIARAHVCGASMGGMIAQHLAARHPQRVSSLTLLMTSSGARGLPQPSWAVRQAMMSRPDGSGLAATVAHYERLFQVIGSPGYRPDPVALRQRLERSVRRSYHPAGVVRQMVAIAADGDRSAMLKQIQAPTHVIHGEADPLIPVGAAHDLLRKIAGASRDLIPGMGHDLPAPLLPRLAAGMAMNAARA